jgi:hypothetical protein
MIELSVIRDLVAIFGVIGGFTYYILTVRNAQRTRELTLRAQEQAVETRQAQLLMQVYNRFDSPEKIRAFQEVFHWEFSDSEEYFEKYYRDSNPEAHNSATTLITFFEGVGTLVKMGDLPLDRVYTLMGGLTINLWGKFEPIKEQLREQLKFPRWASETEYLYHELIRYEAEHPELKT